MKNYLERRDIKRMKQSFEEEKKLKPSLPLRIRYTKKNGEVVNLVLKKSTSRPNNRNTA